MFVGDRYGSNSDVQMEQQQDTIFVQGLPDDVNEDAIAQHFGSIGVIKVSREFPRVQLGTCFVNTIVILSVLPL